MDNNWIKFDEQKPPHKVVLAAFDSYDCGWVIDTAWWYEKEKCWMNTGSSSSRANLPYTHWRMLPPNPDGYND